MPNEVDGQKENVEEEEEEDEEKKKLYLVGDEGESWSVRKRKRSNGEVESLLFNELLDRCAK